MSNPTPPPPDWLPYAIDRLRDVGFDEAAGCLETGHDVRARLERAIDLIEWAAAHQIPHSVGGYIHLVEIIAEHRGEDVADTYRRLIRAVPIRRERETPAGNPWAAAIDMAPLIERELERRRQGVEDFLRENNADPAIHNHIIYPAPGERMFDCGREPSDHVVRASRGHIHALIPWADMEGRSMRPTRDEVMSRGSRWPWRLI